MKNYLFLLAVFFAFASLATAANDDKEAIGVYGVELGSNDGSYLIKLAINEDHTFHYYNVENADRKVDVKGKWKLHKNKIILSDYGSDMDIRDKWKIDKGCVKSRRALYFMRICPIE